jgi:hypothetical protein
MSEKNILNQVSKLIVGTSNNKIIPATETKSEEIISLIKQIDEPKKVKTLSELTEKELRHYKRTGLLPQ